MATPKAPQLGTRIKASGYMVRRSTQAQWWARNPDADPSDAPKHGFKTWRRERVSFSGVFVGVRVLTIKHWWWKSAWYPDDPEYVFASKRTPITFWLIAYSTRAKFRYVLPKDVEEES